MAEQQISVNVRLSENAEFPTVNSDKILITVIEISGMLVDPCRKCLQCIKGQFVIIVEKYQIASRGNPGRSVSGRGDARVDLEYAEFDSRVNSSPPFHKRASRRVGAAIVDQTQLPMWI